MPLSICLSTLPRSRGWFFFLTLKSALNPWTLYINTQHKQSQPPKQHSGEAHPLQLHRLALCSSKMPLKIVASSVYPSVSTTVLNCSQKKQTKTKKKNQGHPYHVFMCNSYPTVTCNSVAALITCFSLLLDPQLWQSKVSTLRCYLCNSGREYFKIADQRNNPGSSMGIILITSSQMLRWSGTRDQVKSPNARVAYLASSRDCWQILKKVRLKIKREAKLTWWRCGLSTVGLGRCGDALEL